LAYNGYGYYSNPVYFVCTLHQQPSNTKTTKFTLNSRSHGTSANMMWNDVMWHLAGNIHTVCITNYTY